MPEDNFFSSQIVLDSIREIMYLQNEVLVFSQYAEFATIIEQQNNLDLLRRLMAKQKIMCFRCTMTDSPDAKNLLNEVLYHFEIFGHTVYRDNPMLVFDEVSDNLDDIEFQLDFFSKYGRYPDDEDEGGETPPTTML